LIVPSFRDLFKESKDLHSCLAHAHVVSRQIHHLERHHRKGRISAEHLKRAHEQKHEGKTRHEWLSACEAYARERGKRIHHHLNERLLQPPHPGITALLLVALALGFIALLTPSLVGLVTGGPGTIALGRTFASDAVVPLGISGMSSFWVDGSHSAGFRGKVTLLDSSREYVLVDERPDISGIPVEGATLAGSFTLSRTAPGVVAITPAANLDESACTVYSYADTRACFGDGICCAFLDAEQKGGQWNETLYLHSQKPGVTERTVVTAQLAFANISVDPRNAFSDVRYSNRSRILVDLFGQRQLPGSCGEACGLRDSTGPYALRV